MSELAEVLSLIAKHLPLIELVVQAIRGGVSEEAIVNAIKKEMTNASDEEMRRELPP